MSIQHDPMTGDEKMFLVSSTLIELQIARTTVNLLDRLQQRQQVGNLVTGAAAVIGDMHGLVATSASLALYDGEDAYNFAAVLGNDVICGVFDHADKLLEDDQITAVVSRRGDVLYCHSLRRESDQLLMLPVSTHAGRDALYRKSIRFAWKSCIGLWIVLLIVCTFFMDFDPERPRKLYFLGTISLLFPPLIIFPLEWSTYRTAKELGEYASKIFKVYGIPDPDNFDALRGLRLYPAPGLDFFACDYALALSKQKSRKPTAK